MDKLSILQVPKNGKQFKIKQYDSGKANVLLYAP